LNSANNLIKIAQQTLQIEAEALLELRAHIGASFAACVQAIYNSSGRLVVTGIGKSAIVAQKIVATLNSTGSPALFMHAADAIHGDLGMIRAGDMVLCLSKSGDTPEIKVLSPLVKNMGAPLIGMTSRADSFLGLQSDFLLLTPISQEADPNNLAPTASTTAQMAMGDALAVALLSLRGFSSQDFALFHPGGALGKQLCLRVSDLYPRNHRHAVQLQDSLRHIMLMSPADCLCATAVID